MLRSYSALARSLNLSETVATLGSTRQTIRRHINALEEIRGEKLFEMRNSQYHLTEAGARSLRDAEAILARGEAWLDGHARDVDGVALVKEKDKKTQEARPVFCAQQHHLSRLWIDPSPLLQQGLRGWASGGAKLESPEMDPVRPYCVVYRRHGENWLCVEIGEKSSYASWFGWTWAKSSVGRFMVETPAGPAYARFISEAYDDVGKGYSVRLDHICTRIPRRRDGPLLPVSFQRMLLGSSFPDGEFALVVLADRTYNISINGLEKNQIREMPEDLLTVFETNTVNEQE